VQFTNHIVVTRPGYELRVDAPDETDSSIIDVRGMTAGEISRVSAETARPNVYITDAVMVDVSATDIRQAASGGRHEELQPLVPAAVADYIIKYELYKNSNEN
jgi:nicotinic acid mononucleotide adenylyltransferase